MPDLKTPLIWLLGVLLLGALVVAGVERTQVLKARADLSEEKAARQKDRADRAVAYSTDSDSTANKEGNHAADSQKASDKFTAGAPDRAVALADDLQRARRLQNDAERRAARYRTQSEGDAAERGRLASLAATLDSQLAAGVKVVAGLRGDLVRRDAEVVLLLDQIDADRLLLAPATEAPKVGGFRVPLPSIMQAEPPAPSP